LSSSFGFSTDLHKQGNNLPSGVRSLHRTNPFGFGLQLSVVVFCRYGFVVFVVVVFPLSQLRRRRRRFYWLIVEYTPIIMTFSTPTLVFPTPVLTPIVGRPTNSTLQIMQQQLYQNARSVASDRGGGALGHLALIMTPAAYLLRDDAVAFAVPVNPGPLGPAPAAATTVQRDDRKRVHDNNSQAFATYQAVRTALTNQIIAAVEPTYLQTLCDVDFGFADVLPYTMLAHLKNTYGTLTGLEIEQNRARLGEAWDTSSPIETLWARITEIRRIATNAQQPISDAAVIALVLPMFERTGLFLHSVNSWNSLDLAAQTYALFMTHFTRANELRITALTSNDLKFADANLATKVVTPPRTTTPRSVNAPRITTTEATIEGTTMYYCWSHGLSTLSVHTGHTCRQPKPGHIASATAFNRQGGSNTFSTREDRPPRRQHTTTTAPAT
jgi:hypothetical protein